MTAAPPAILALPIPAPPIPASDDLLALLTRDTIEAIADRPHESDSRRQARADGAMRLIEAFDPEDGVEIMLAGQTVLMQNLVLDAVRDSHHSTTVDNAFRNRQQAQSMLRTQLSFLKEIGLRRAGRALPAEVVPFQIAPAPVQQANTAPAIPPEQPVPPAGAPRPDEVPILPPRGEPGMTAAPMVQPGGQTPTPPEQIVQTRPSPPPSPHSMVPRPVLAMTRT